LSVHKKLTGEKEKGGRGVGVSSKQGWRSPGERGLKEKEKKDSIQRGTKRYKLAPRGSEKQRRGFYKKLNGPRGQKEGLLARKWEEQRRRRGLQPGGREQKRGGLTRNLKLTLF